MEVNGFAFGKLDILKKNIDDPKTGIPKQYGIYQWVYWPAFDENIILKSDLIDLLKTYTKTDFYIEEVLTGLYKFQATICEQGYKANENMFGLSDSKQLELESFFDQRDNIIFFSKFFQEVCFTRPFYLGKADNLRQRLSNHFKGRTNVLKEITTKGIPEKDIWVGHKIIPAPTNTNLNTILEEIYTRKVKPGLTIKPN